MTNSSLNGAKSVKNDEFYTQLADVEREMYAYINYDPNVFRDKTVLLPCDDPEWSAFTMFFVQKFDELGLKKLISTSYNKGGSSKVYTVKRDKRRKKTDFNSIDLLPLSYDGDFRSAEVTALRDESDFVITNPPFSLFREFVAWIRGGGQQFSLIGNKNCITYKEIFPLIQANQAWAGTRPMSNDFLFIPPKGFSAEGLPASKTRWVKGDLFLRAPAIWLTNIDHGKRHEPLSCLSMKDNLAVNKKVQGPRAYKRYDNYNAIEVPASNAIPSDYRGVMGVPISYLDKFCPEQFELVGATESEGRGFSNGLWDADSGVLQALIDGEKVFKRLFIKKRFPKKTAK